MDANNAADFIISSVKKSNLNFYLQESPFSLHINIRKTFVKNKDGHLLYPSSNDTSDDTIEQKLNIKKLKKEKSDIFTKLEDAMAENLAAKKELKKLEKENEALKKKNNELQVNIETLKSVKNTVNKNMKSREKEIASLEAKNKDLEEKLNSVVSMSLTA